MSDQFQLAELLAQVGEIGKRLVEISENSKRSSSPLDESAIPLGVNAVSEEITRDRMRAFSRLASEEYQARFNRKRFLSKDIFGEPSWDILLDLFVSRVEGVRLSVKSVCIASQVPLTTALRWISVLEREGLLEKFPDPLDARRTWIELTDKGFYQMFCYFNESRKSSYSSSCKSPNLEIRLSNDSN